MLLCVLHFEGFTAIVFFRFPQVSYVSLGCPTFFVSVPGCFLDFLKTVILTHKKVPENIGRQ